MKTKKSKKFYFILVIFLIMVISGISLTIAFLVRQDSTSNQFMLGVVTPEIIEIFDTENKVKRDVAIKNSGNVPIYIRTLITIYFKDNEGNVLADAPVGNLDYQLTLSTSANWILSEEGYYYYKTPINPDDLTDVLIEECKELKAYDDKILVVDVIAQAIQAEPEKAAEEAWNVNIVNNTLSLTN